MTLRRTVLTGTASLAMVAAVVVAGCASSTSSSSSSSSAAPAAPASSSPSTPAPSAAASSASAGSAGSAGSASNGAANPTAAAGGPPACATRDLKATVGVAQGAAGSVYQVIDFTNIGTASCSLYGYPGVALAGGNPVTQIGAAASRSTTSAPSLVTLAAGATANALLRITRAVNYPSSRCGPVASTYLQIYPPNQTTPMYLAYKSTGCSATGVNVLSVGVVQAGNGG